jgi:hypothetical protein
VTVASGNRSCAMYGSSRRIETSATRNQRVQLGSTRKSDGNGSCPVTARITTQAASARSQVTSSFAVPTSDFGSRRSARANQPDTSRNAGMWKAYTTS